MTQDDITTIVTRASDLRRDYIRAWLANFFRRTPSTGFHGTLSAGLR